MKNSFILGLLSLAAVSGDCSAKDSFLDLYVGGGIGLEFAKNDNTFETTAPNIDALGNIVPGSIISNDFDGRYSDRKIKDSRTTRPSASFVLGVGKHNKNGTYVGVEGGIDISKNREIKTNGGMGYDYTANLLNATSHSDIKLNAISYNLGVLLGLYNR